MNAGFVTIRVNVVTRYVTFVAEIVTNATEVVANPAVTAMVRQAARSSHSNGSSTFSVPTT